MNTPAAKRCSICKSTEGSAARCLGCGRRIDAGELSTDDVARDAVGARILVATPQCEVGADVAERLAAQGYAPVCVSSGARAVAAFSPELPERPAAAILDVTLADLVVPSIIDHLRKDLGLADVPIVLLAAVHNSSRYRRRPQRLYGANVALEYPDGDDQLLEELAGLLGGGRRTGLRQPPELDEHETGQLARRLLSDVALFFNPEPLIPDGVPLDVGLSDDGVAGARGYCQRAGGEAAVESFEQELRVLRARFAEDPAAKMEALP